MSSMLGPALAQQRIAEFNALDFSAQALAAVEIEIFTHMTGQKEAARRSNARQAVANIEALDAYTDDADMAAIMLAVAALAERMHGVVQSSERRSLRDSIETSLGWADAVAGGSYGGSD